MRKVQIEEPGDTRFLEQQVVDKLEFMEENDRIWGKKVVVDAGDSQNLQCILFVRWVIYSTRMCRLTF